MTNQSRDAFYRWINSFAPVNEFHTATDWAWIVWQAALSEGRRLEREEFERSVRDAIITDQATSSADYGEAEEYADKIIAQAKAGH